MSRREIKTIAKAEFKDHWGVLLLVLALEYVAECMATVLGFGIGSLIVSGPLCVGIYYVYTKTIYNEGTDWKDMFFGFRTMFGNSFVVNILVSCIIGLAGIVISVVGIIISSIISKIATSVSSSGYSYDDYSYGYPYDYSYGSSLMTSVGIGFVSMLIVGIVIAILGIIIELIYAEAPLILLKEPGIKPVDALKKSRLMMRGNKGRLFIFVLSFIGWLILCVLTLGVLLVYVAPYITYAYVLLLNQIYEERHGVSMDDDADMQKLNAMRENVRNKKEAVTDKIKEKTADTKPVAPPTEPSEPPVEPAPPAPPVEPADLNVCKYCGAKLPEGASFCGKCGRKQ